MLPLLVPLALAWIGAFAPAPPSTPQGDPSAPAPDAVEEARQALARGDYERAHALVQGLLFRQRLEVALELEQAGRDREALTALRRALALDLRPVPAPAQAARARIEGRVLAGLLARAEPAVLANDARAALPLLDEMLSIDAGHPRANLLRARAALALGEEIGEVFLFQDALASAESAAPAEPAARYYGARAARLLHYADGDPAPLERAIFLARALLADLAAGRIERTGLPAAPGPEQVLAEALFDRYRLARQNGETQRAQELAEGTRAALEAWLGNAPDDEAPWRQLAAYHEWAGDAREAAAVLERGIDVLPEALPLHEHLARLARGLGGPAETVRVYTAIVERHGSSALAHWFLAQDQLELALELLDARVASPVDFGLAAASFARARALNPDYAEACKGREALCRAGVGWVHLWADELDTAERAFRSMEETLPGGLEWQYPGRLFSGVDSLNRLAGRWYARSQDEERPQAERDEALVQAARIVRSLTDYRPTDPSLANDAGFLNRDAAEALERGGSALVERGAAQGRPELVEQGLGLLARARETMEASYASYVRASELSPDDARVVNDTGLILTYYLRREPETARAYHQRAIAVGLPRIEAGDLAQDDDLHTAVGDAYQNLGYLELCWRGDAAAALLPLEASMAHAPWTREDVPGFLLPLARHVLEGRLDAATVVTAHLWAPTDAQTVLARAAARRSVRAAFEG